MAFNDRRDAEIHRFPGLLNLIAASKSHRRLCLVCRNSSRPDLTSLHVQGRLAQVARMASATTK